MNKKWIGGVMARGLPLGLIACTDRAGDSTGNQRADPSARRRRRPPPPVTRRLKWPNWRAIRPVPTSASPEVRQDAAAVGKRNQNPATQPFQRSTTPPSPRR